MARPGINNKTIYATFLPKGRVKTLAPGWGLVLRGGENVNNFNNVLLISGAITITTGSRQKRKKEALTLRSKYLYTPPEKGSLWRTVYMSAPFNHGLCPDITVRQQSKGKFSLP